MTEFRDIPAIVDESIGAAWSDYHGHIPTDLIPDPPPAFIRGYLAGHRDARGTVTDDITIILGLLDGLADQWGDEGVFRTCRDRLRTLTSTHESHWDTIAPLREK
jgi:hypothetical protein